MFILTYIIVIITIIIVIIIIIIIIIIITREPGTIIIPVNKHQIYSTYPIFTF